MRQRGPQCLQELSAQLCSPGRIQQGPPPPYCFSCSLSIFTSFSCLQSATFLPLPCFSSLLCSLAYPPWESILVDLLLQGHSTRHPQFKGAGEIHLCSWFQRFQSVLSWFQGMNIMVGGRDRESCSTHGGWVQRAGKEPKGEEESDQIWSPRSCPCDPPDTPRSMSV